MIGINSGNNAKFVGNYAKSVKSEAAFYSDNDRSFEQSTVKGEINLKNIMQFYILTPDGKMDACNGTADDVKKHLPKAKWRVDSKEIPDPLKKAWLAFEFGQYATATPLIKQAATAADAKVKAAAVKIETLIKEEIAKRMTEAQASVTAGDKWKAFKKFDYVAQNFKLYPEGGKSTAEMGKLRSDAKVTKELQAKGMLEKIQEMVASPKKTERDMAKPGLEMLQSKFPDTEAGEASKNVKLPEDKKKAA